MTDARRSSSPPSPSPRSSCSGYDPRTSPDPRSTEALFRKTKKIDDDEFLRPYKLLLPDIVTSEACLPKALEYANALYSALGGKGHHVMLSPTDIPLRRASIEEREKPRTDKKYGRYGNGTIWSPYRPTVTFIGSVPIGLAIIEMTERATLRHLKGRCLREDSDTVRSAKSWQLANSWTHEQDVPSGRFRVVAYSTCPGVDWQMSWQETSTRPLVGMMTEIIKKLSDVSVELAQKQAEADLAAARRKREWEEQQEQWRRKEDQRSVAAARQASQLQLSQIIQQWSSAVAVEQFFREAEARIAATAPDRQVQLSERLALAREMIGTLDPLDFLGEWIAPEERYRRRYPVD